MVDCSVERGVRVALRVVRLKVRLGKGVGGVNVIMALHWGCGYTT